MSLESIITARIIRLYDLRKEAYELWKLSSGEEEECYWLEFEEHSYKIEALEGILEEYRRSL